MKKLAFPKRNISQDQTEKFEYDTDDSNKSHAISECNIEEEMFTFTKDELPRAEVAKIQ